MQRIETGRAGRDCRRRDAVISILSLATQLRAMLVDDGLKVGRYLRRSGTEKCPHCPFGDVRRISAIDEPNHPVGHIRLGRSATADDLEFDGEVRRAEKSPFDIRSPDNLPLAIRAKVIAVQLSEELPMDRLIPHVSLLHQISGETLRKRRLAAFGEGLADA